MCVCCFLHCFLHDFLPSTFVSIVFCCTIRWWVVFNSAAAFNADVSKWTVAQVTNTAGMFWHAKNFTRIWCSTEWVEIISNKAFVNSPGRVVCCPVGNFFNTTKGDCEFCAIGEHNNDTRVKNNLPTSCSEMFFS